MRIQLPLPKKGTRALPHFSAHVCYGQTAGWIKATWYEGSLSSGHNVLDEDQAPPQRGIAS